MTHTYPPGAIEDEKTLMWALLGQTLYSVHGLGKQSWITEMLNVRNLHTNDSDFREIEFDEVSHYLPVIALSSSSCLGDLNIGGHHNDHYLFSKREDAEAYLAWAKIHTAPPGRHQVDGDLWYDDDYEYSEN